VIQITDHLGQIRARVTQALIRCGRSGEEVTIVAVSKQQPVERIRELFSKGITNFGESYADEAIAKVDQLSDLEITWHFIGRIQANKTRRIAEHFDWVHSVDRLRVAQRLSEQRPWHAEALNVLIQVNPLKEPQKGGADPEEALDLARAIADFPRLRYRGLMAIPPAGIGHADLLEFYGRVRALGDALAAGGYAGDTFSMGMSRDFEAAIAAGSNCVRIGTALFGPRPG
jgi:pyridoxal phosphate enzyme (YggS family)